jgi:hypothetical protein
MKINGISGSAIGGVNRRNIDHSRSSNIGSSGSPLMDDQLSFKNIKLEERDPLYTGKYHELNDVLYRLFVDILSNGIVIVASYPRDYGSFVMEASFKAMDNRQAHHQINLPMRGVRAGEKFAVASSPYVAPTAKIKKVSYDLVAKIVATSNKDDIRRLIIVATHEFGHFLSWEIGNHNTELKHGLELMQRRATRSNFSSASAVYREEMLAWNLGRSRLYAYGFESMVAYDQLKDESLNTYYKELHLQDAPIEIHSRMSLYR